jgi:hypothetical protein
VPEKYQKIALAAWSTYLVLSSPPDTEETGAMGRVIESRHGNHSLLKLLFLKSLKKIFFGRLWKKRFPILK